MIIKGYNVKWQESGWSYGVPVVRRKSLFLGTIPYWKKVWEGKAISRGNAEKMHPDEMKKWFTEAVDEFEEYIKAWSKYQ